LNKGPKDEWRFPNRATPLGSSSYYSIRFSPPELRQDLAVLHAWRHQLRAILDDVSDPGVARLKLQWWREELQHTCEGEPRHPLSFALHPVLARHGLPAGPFLQMADRVDDEILRRHPRDEAQLAGTCERDLGALFDLASRCHGIDDPDQIRAARNLGAFCGLVYLIRDSGALARQGRTLLPTDSLSSLGLSPERLRERDHRARLPELLPDTARQARELLEASGDYGRLPPFARIRCALLATLLRELEDSEFDVAEQRIGITALRKLWLAWRESLAA
jgi:phytoene synthase